MEDMAVFVCQPDIHLWYLPGQWFFIDLFKPFPDIYWFLWSLIQLNISKIEFDYYNYGKVKYENALGNMDFIREAYGVAV